MTKPINLNKVRKARAAVKNRLQADENAVKYGRTKAERVAEAARNAQARRKLDEHHLDDE